MDYKKNRAFAKGDLQFDFTKPYNPLDGSDQTKGIPKPPAEKPYNEEDLIYLPNPIHTELKKRDIFDIMDSRESKRKPTGDGQFTLGELSFILWATQGVRINNNPMGDKRTVPSAGSLYPFDSYILALNVKNLQKGLYRYVWSKQAVIPAHISEENIDAFSRYMYPIGAINIFWVMVPYRGEWRYMQHSHKAALLDAGHIGQNGYLAAEALGRGCCTSGGYSQADVDRLLGIDAENEFTSYIGVFM